MSKKKAFSGSTMSLKDFHGGSIPSDLPLPSAPGLIMGSNSDRQMWGNTMGRSDHRLRPKSAGAVRKFNEKASLLSHHENIGRNFDEDERRPFDGVSAPRRSISDESIRAAPPICQELKLDYVSSVRPIDRHERNVDLQSPSFASSSPMGRDAEVSPVGGNSQNPSGNNGRNVSSSHPNAWGMRKDVMGGSGLGASFSLSGTNVVSKFAQASAVEKVSSGRWQSKSPMQLLPHLLYSKDDDKSNGVDLVSERGNYDATQGNHAEGGGISEDGIQGSAKELSSKERIGPLNYTEEGGTEANIGRSPLQSVVHSDLPERPKLKLLPRAKPLENLEKDYKQVCQQPSDSGKVEVVSELYGNASTIMQGLTIGQSGNQPVERPKLNLKARSQPLEPSKGNIERERSTLFGGACPRELVLKGRVIDDITINNLDLSHTPNRPTDSTKTEAMLDHLRRGAGHVDRTENLALEKRIGERKNLQMDAERLDIQRNWRNENWKGSTDTEKLQQDWQPGADVWRKPTEQPKSASPDASGIRYAKVASALELAQAFSRSISDPKRADQISGEGRDKMHFHV